MSAKKLAVIILFVFVAVGLVATGISSLNQLACEGQPINFRIDPTAEQQLWGDQLFSQSFIAPRNGLNRIDIMFQTYERQNTHQVGVQLLEISPDAPWSGTLISEFTFNAATVRDRVWRSFAFPAIADSAGKSYLIQIQSPDSTPGNAITVGGIEWDTYAPGTAYLGPVPLRADITFRACFRMTTVEKLQVLSGQLTQNRPGLWGNAAFFWGSLVLYALVTGSFFGALTKLVLQK